MILYVLTVHCCSAYLKYRVSGSWDYDAKRGIKKDCKYPQREIEKQERNALAMKATAEKIANKNAEREQQQLIKSNRVDETDDDVVVSSMCVPRKSFSFV
jgi:hypothetical protein